MFHKEGFRIIAVTFLIFAALSILVHFKIENDILQKGLFLVLLILVVLILQFFRNPKRNFILTWTNDTFAYLIGKRFGKRKLKEKISPKKTIEGFIGGLLAALIGGAIIFNTTLLYSPAFWLLLALLVSILGTSGDLIQSKFKRLAGVKDSGRIMPGHGGVYDRLDSIIFASPFIYLFIIFINYVS